MTARNRELMGLIPVSLLVTAGFAAVFAARQSEVGNASLTYGAIFLGLCLVVHLFIRATLPHADPYLFPLCALLAAIGLVVVYRIDEALARQQAGWFVAGIALFALTVLLLRDVRVLERYRYIIAALGIGLLMLPRLPGIGAQVNGAYLGVDIGPLSFQPTEFAKICIVIFLASYLNERGEAMVASSRRVLGMTIPRLKHFGPLLVVWGCVDADAGRDPRPRQLADVLRGLPGGAVRVDRPRLVRRRRPRDVRRRRMVLRAHGRTRAGTHRHLARSLEGRGGVGIPDRAVAVRAGRRGMLGEGLGNALLNLPGGAQIPPAPDTDLIYAVIVNELGLFGATGVVIAYLLFAERGFRVAVLAEDGFTKLLAAGLTAVFALQAFVIVGGVTRVIPLTGVTLPFVSYGGSSIVANFVLLALLLMVSEQARAPRARHSPVVER